ncbi:TPA: hypothetical protein EYO12_02730 [Candidatus Saccharibacteria bacterium]|nr:hypothetical protein [Candidatus Saccharibacteria bacterium]HIO88045.1 hypothetical protein [Candidatus Saccharibacteria bacterium]
MLKLLVSLLIVVTIYSPTQALSVIYCEEDTIECEIQNCETENTVIDWENEYSEQKRPLNDCGTLDRAEQDRSIQLAISALTLGAIALTYVHLKVKSKKLN